MNTISSQSMAPASARQEALSDAQFSSYVRKQSLSAYESVAAGLTIKTKEGDLVTLSSSSYARMDSYMYDSKGVLKTEAGTVAVSQNIREITLTTGESFAFSVSGDLNEEELADIENIVKGIDDIISRMAKGDMEGAVADARAMGGYDSISMYSANITYEKSYAMRSEVQAQRGISSSKASLPKSEIFPSEESVISPELKPFVENYSSGKNKNNSIYNISQFIEKMAEKFEKYDEMFFENLQKPVDKLFRHHLGRMKEDKEATPHYNAIENAQNKISKLIDKMLGEKFA